MKQEQIRLDLEENKQLNIFGEVESVADLSTETDIYKVKIDYDNLVEYLKRNNLYTEELENCLDSYMKFYNR